MPFAQYTLMYTGLMDRGLFLCDEKISYNSIALNAFYGTQKQFHVQARSITRPLGHRILASNICRVRHHKFHPSPYIHDVIHDRYNNNSNNKKHISCWFDFDEFQIWRHAKNRHIDLSNEYINFIKLYENSVRWTTTVKSTHIDLKQNSVSHKHAVGCSPFPHFQFIEIDFEHIVWLHFRARRDGWVGVCVWMRLSTLTIDTHKLTQYVFEHDEMRKPHIATGINESQCNCTLYSLNWSFIYAYV